MATAPAPPASLPSLPAVTKYVAKANEAALAAYAPGEHLTYRLLGLMLDEDGKPRQLVARVEFSSIKQETEAHIEWVQPHPDKRRKAAVSYFFGGEASVHEDGTVTNSSGLGVEGAAMIAYAAALSRLGLAELHPEKLELSQLTARLDQINETAWACAAAVHAVTTGEELPR